MVFTAGSVVAGEGEPVSRIYVLDLAGGVAKPITDSKRHCRDASWSPDGKRLCFSSPANIAE